MVKTIDGERKIVCPIEESEKSWTKGFDDTDAWLTDEEIECALAGANAKKEEETKNRAEAEKMHYEILSLCRGAILY